MKKITLLFIFCLALANISYSQCTTSTGGQWPSGVVSLANSGGAETISTNNWPNAEFSLIDNVLPGSDYTVLASPSLYITVTNTADDSVIAHNVGSVSFTAPAGVTALTIYWHLDASCGTQNSGNTQTTIQCTSCACTSTAPAMANTPSPGDNAVDVEFVESGGDSLIELSWADGGSGSSAAESYIFYIGLTNTGDDIGSLTVDDTDVLLNYTWAENTQYYWKIETVNCNGSVMGPVWSFTTFTCTETVAPSAATTPMPADAETNTSIQGPDGTVAFSWTVADPDDTFILNLGTANPPAQPFYDFENGGTITGLAVNTTYFWSVDIVNCAGTTTGTVWSFTTDSSLSIEENQIESFSVYPNPTADIINIKSNKEIDDVTVFNLLGQRVATFGENEIINNAVNLEGLSNGLYLVKITAENTTQTIRVTKE